jgi:UDPglucose 6-dehydrogenase
MRPVGVIGLGLVGGTVAEAFEGVGVPVRGYDRYRDVGRAGDLWECGVVFLCVPTPGREDGSHDLREVWSAVEEVEPYLGEGSVIAVKSTVPPGTSDLLKAAFPRIEFASVPEFLTAARPMETFTHPDRVVIGSSSSEVASRLGELLRRVAPEAPIVALRPVEAELVKLCSNVLLAAKVTLANELANISGLFGVSWSRIQGVVGLDRRIGPDHLTVSAERGFGGMCLPKDLDALIAASRAGGYGPPILEEIARFNREIRYQAQVLGDGHASSPTEPGAVESEDGQVPEKDAARR